MAKISYKAEAIKQFTKQQNYSIEIQNYANIFCIEAQIKLGEMLKDMPKNEGVKLAGKDTFGGTKTEPPKEDEPPTYAEIGINKKDASRWQQMAEHKKEITEKICPKMKGEHLKRSNIKILPLPKRKG